MASAYAAQWRIIRHFETLICEFSWKRRFLRMRVGRDVNKLQYCPFVLLKKKISGFSSCNSISWELLWRYQNWWSKSKKIEESPYIMGRVPFSAMLKLVSKESSVNSEPRKSSRPLGIVGLLINQPNNLENNSKNEQNDDHCNIVILAILGRSQLLN